MLLGGGEAATHVAVEGSAVLCGASADALAASLAAADPPLPAPSSADEARPPPEWRMRIAPEASPSLSH